MAEAEDRLDCAVIGAGPAGLTALTYLARFHRRAVALGGAGPRPRLLLIDRSYNLPGYPSGVSGAAILQRLRAQAEEMGGVVLDSVAQRVIGTNGDFTVETADGQALRARKVILAMGVHDIEPDIPGIQRHVGQFLRYCPVCDGYEHTGRQLGILGFGAAVARHALFLETFSNRISVFLHGHDPETLGVYREVLDARGIAWHTPRVVGIMEEPDSSPMGYRGTGVCLEDGSEHPLAVLYGALGCDLHLDPVRELDLRVDEDGYLVTDINQQTSLPGIYAAGDLVSQINQISVAFGQAAIAAVRIHNELQEEG